MKQIILMDYLFFQGFSVKHNYMLLAKTVFPDLLPDYIVLAKCD